MPLLRAAGLAAQVFYELTGFTEQDPSGRVREARARADAFVPIPGDDVFTAVERIHGDLASVHELLQDPARTSVRLVTNPERIVVAETDDRLVMGLAHTSLPVHGVQFHPESIASEHGHLLLKNFIDIAAAWNAATGRQRPKKAPAQEIKK